MAAINTDTRSSIGKLLRLLGSDRDGEVLGAVRALRRVLTSNKLDLHDLAHIVEAPPVASPNGNGHAGSGFRNWHDDTVETEVPWRDMVAACMQRLDRFTDKERKFIRSIEDWRGEPSARQLGWLAALFERVRGMP
jgi:hypothetical protein